MIALPWLLAVAVLGLVMAISDARSATIPNLVPVGLLVLYGIGAAFLFPLDRSLTSGLAGAVLLVVAFALFALGLLPGGDGKALAASALVISPADWLSVILAVWLLTVFFLLARRLAGHPFTDPFPFGVPLGVALAAHALLPMSPLLF